jgi:hypothetical protein
MGKCRRCFGGGGGGGGGRDQVAWWSGSSPWSGPLTAKSKTAPFFSGVFVTTSSKHFQTALVLLMNGYNVRFKRTLFLNEHCF